MMRKVLILIFCLSVLILLGPSNVLAQEETPPQSELPVIVEPPIPTTSQPQPTETKPLPETPFPPPTFDSGITEEWTEPVEFIDPREIQETLRQLSQMKSDIQRLLKKAKKSQEFSNELNGLNELLSENNRFTQSIKTALSGGGTNQREALQEFYDAELWNTLDIVRTKIELPTELKNIERDLKKLEKLVATKNFAVEGINLDFIKEQIAEIKNAATEARNNFNQGNFEDARNALEIIWEGTHPGEIMGVLQQLRDISRKLKSLKKEVRDEIFAAMAPIYDAANDGNFREANIMLGDVRQELSRVLTKVKTKRVINEELRKNLNGLEQKLQNKIQNIESKKPEQSPLSKKYEPYKPYQSASLIQNITDGLKRLFGL